MAATTPITDPLFLGPHLVPGVWRYMLPDDLQFMKIPAESRSACHSCPKVKEAGFHPDYRCCTYHPRVPNFLLGFALQDAKTTARIAKCIEGKFTTPEGMLSTSRQLRTSLTNAVRGEFGASTAVRCQFLDLERRQCGIYPYRNSVCSTFFCKHDDAKSGPEFWNHLQSLAGQVETSLSQWVMTELGMDVAAYFERFDSMASDIDAFCDPKTEAWTDEGLRILWADWFGQETEFFRAAANMVESQKHRLYEIASKIEILTAPAYQRALRASLDPGQKAELDANHSDEGEPAAISDLWYLTQVANRNLSRPAGL